MTRMDQPNPRKTGNGQSRPAAIRDDLMRAGRQHRLYRKIAISVLLTLTLLALLFYGRERIGRQDYYKALQALQRQIDEFQVENHRLPRQEEFSRFELRKRTLSLLNIQYNIDQILEESPPETVLVYTPALKSKIYANKHVVLSLNGQQTWLSSDELQDRLNQNERFYNSKMLQPREAVR